MELKDFIAQTISQIMEGVKEAQRLSQESGGAVNPIGQMYLAPGAAQFQDKGTTRIGDFVNFDVAIEVTEGKEESGGAKISVPSIGGFGGKLFRKRQNKLINRVSFRLPVIYPKGKYEEEKAVTFPLHSPSGSFHSSNADSSANVMTTTGPSQTSPSVDGEEG